MPSADRIVVAGASLGGLRAAEALRAEGFTGRITLVGDEPPYDRPPLSKAVPAGTLSPDALALPAARDDLDAEWILGTVATGLDRSRGVVTTADGRDLAYDGLVVATGTRARPWPDPAQAALDGVVTVRTREDAVALRSLLAVPGRRVLVVGAGFVGSEVASVAHDLGHTVTVVERGEAPLVTALGGPLGAVAADVQRAAGIDLRTSVSVRALEGTDGRVCRARLSDGTSVDADVVVVALGALRNVEWLAGSGLVADARGALCDASCRAVTVAGGVDERVVTVGDVARWPHPVLGGEPVAVEHWQNAVDMAAVAAHNLVAPDDLRPHDALPLFWSNQFGLNVKSVGFPSLADEVTVTQGSVDDRLFVAAYGRAGVLVGAVAFDKPRALDAYATLIAARTPFPPDLHAADAPVPGLVLPARFPHHVRAAVPAPASATAAAPSSTADPAPAEPAATTGRRSA